MNSISHIQCRGYIEGYYGRLLEWDDRHALVRQLNGCGMSSYFYAPKEDIYHRLHWRKPYPASWRDSFAIWCDQAKSESIHIIAGLAPGLDFNFNHIKHGDDFSALVTKAKQLLDDGASAIALLMDDINTVFDSSENDFVSEGQAHACLANALSEAIGHKLFTVPRVYAQELEYESPGYAKAYSQQLETGNVVFHCGTHIVAPSVHSDDYADYANKGRHRVVVWDNLYANDYCPRRLYVGPWLGRVSQPEVMLNPTGLLATDLLLLDIMARQGDASAQAADTNSTQTHQSWLAALHEHQVPEAFDAVQCYFRHPPVIAANASSPDKTYSTEQQLEAIEYLLWKWKTPLSREWYPFLFGLKHDLSVAAGKLTASRIRKTQLPPMADHLLQKILQKN